MEPYNSTLNASHRAVLKDDEPGTGQWQTDRRIAGLASFADRDSWSTAALAKEMNETYHFLPSAETMESVARLLDLQFFTKTAKKKIRRTAAHFL